MVLIRGQDYLCLPLEVLGSQLLRLQILMDLQIQTEQLSGQAPCRGKPEEEAPEQYLKFTLLEEEEEDYLQHLKFTLLEEEEEDHPQLGQEESPGEVARDQEVTTMGLGTLTVIASQAIYHSWSPML